MNESHQEPQPPSRDEDHLSATGMDLCAMTSMTRQIPYPSVSTFFTTLSPLEELTMLASSYGYVSIMLIQI